jgi:hypothetical protein
LFNLDKFLKFENRDPFAMRAEAGEFAGLTEWDKFAKIEYYRYRCCMKGRRFFTTEALSVLFYLNCETDTNFNEVKA